MLVCPDANERDAVCLRLVNSTETRPFSSCGQAVVQRLMFKEKGGAALGKEAFYRDATRHEVECYGMQSPKREAKKEKKDTAQLNDY